MCRACAVLGARPPLLVGGDYRQATEAPVRVTVTEHRTDGTLARQWQGQTNGSESAQTYEYGPTGLLLRVRFDDGVGPHSLLYVYDLDGQVGACHRSEFGRPRARVRNVPVRR